ncbi:MAG: YajQ family cyclic di-GMP-binding protein [Candidatus Saccharibacteria bacterium]|nr:YajQ family cyclic di-GMP-binding protein [Candidatus Saccharibacteria bacterium]
MANFSFDIESSFDKAEMNNVHQLVLREIANRFDFKGTPADVEWLGDKKGFKVIGADEFQVQTIIDMIGKQLAKRGMTSKVLDLSGARNAANLRAWQDVPFKDGLSQDNAKKITKLLKERHPKVKAQIQGDAVRCTSNSKDELQAVMQTLREVDFDFPLSFGNYR